MINRNRPTSYEYDDAGRLASLTYPSGAVVAYTRNAIGQITGISLDNTPLASSIQYLPFGPVQSLTLGPVNQTRTYDQRYQLNRIQAGTYDVRYTRNLSGLLTTSDGLLDPQLSSETTTTSIQTTSNRIAGVGGKTWTHDANGNVLSDGINSYTWDALNRLIQVKQNGTVLATYLYDSQNRRIGKTASGTTTYYTYDLDSRLISEIQADGTPIREYVYLQNEPLAVREYQKSPGLYFFLNDHLGTPQKLIDTAGAVVWQAAYLPYGEAQVQANSTVTNNLRFPGQYYDEETDLHYNWNRYYDPVLGRYLSPDPIGLEGGLNLYGYVGGDPVNGVDPEGLANLNLFKPGIIQAKQTDSWNPPDCYSVSGHGSPSNMTGPNGEFIFPKNLARKIKDDHENFHGQPVCLDSCSTGKGDNPFAQKLANILGVTVIAPTEDVTVRRTGSTYSRTIDNGGIDKPFPPNKPGY